MQFKNILPLPEKQLIKTVCLITLTNFTLLTNNTAGQ